MMFWKKLFGIDDSSGSDVSPSDSGARAKAGVDLRDEAKRKATEEAERKAQDEAERKVQEDAERQKPVKTSDDELKKLLRECLAGLSDRSTIAAAIRVMQRLHLEIAERPTLRPERIKLDHAIKDAAFRAGFSNADPTSGQEDFKEPSMSSIMNRSRLDQRVWRNVAVLVLMMKEAVSSCSAAGTSESMKNSKAESVWDHVANVVFYAVQAFFPLTDDDPQRQTMFVESFSRDCERLRGSISENALDALGNLWPSLEEPSK